jgi:histidine ammonia-lyase
VRAAREAVRKVVRHLDEDRPLYPDHNAMAAAVERCEVLKAVEEAAGPLGTSW